jgi:hypothetical protein
MDIRKEMIGAREEFITNIKAELLGPGSEISLPDVEHEIITNAPHVRYSMGILFPQANIINSENDDSMRVEESLPGLEVEESDDEDNGKCEEQNVRSANPQESDIEVEEKNLDEEISLASQNLPSSFGMIFFSSKNCSEIACDISFATYRHAKVSDCKFPYLTENPESYEVPLQFSQLLEYDCESKCFKLKQKVQKRDVKIIRDSGSVPDDHQYIFDYAYKLCDQLRSGYVRIPHKERIRLDFSNGPFIDGIGAIDETEAKVTALKRKVSDGLYSITIMLVNDLVHTPNGTNCLHQPTISISTDNNDFNFCEYSDYGSSSLDEEEERSLALLYRNKRIFGTGLGTALEWSIDEHGQGELHNEFFPQAEVPSMDFELPTEAEVPSKALSMKYLSDMNDSNISEKIGCLNTVIDTYSDWIQDLELRVSALSEKHQEAALKNIQNCTCTLERMKNGIRTLESNQNAWKAFTLANRAMFIQREQLKFQEDTSQMNRFPNDNDLAELFDKKVDFFSSQDIHFWRPFQLAFILMSINSVVDDGSKERNIVDLIWFPTGGGKTEAYLGLTAVTIFYRRLSHKKQSSGTAVIMRYTLRLLAAQQFTRASTLICACEYMRMDSAGKHSIFPKYDLGKETISIGLWIGGKHTPNLNEGAKKNLNELLGATVSNIGYKKERFNKFQVLECPWCGTKMVKVKMGRSIMGQWGYKMRNNSNFYMSCTNEKCLFNQKLPVQIVDEELYKNPPTLLFGTVDKFAMLPWKWEVGNFFATDSGNRTPELIIQDELHLISGPLGTMVGLYESAIDNLCSNKGVSPKIVASTATIRNAKEQCSVLYNRDVNQFPSPGLDASDSFFARELKISKEKGSFGRKYIGLMPSGKTKAMMEVRAIAALLQRVYSMDISDEMKDKYWTLTIYFNSLKDLGKCSTLIDDDVKDFIKRMAYRLGTYRNARKIAKSDELTSRVSTTELNETLEKLEKLEYSKANIENRKYASNTLLATNMISVGIDVARLNIMLMVGQPKLTSEYIQASSRIGRFYPGVAFTLYDGAKSRDRSHYEQFKSYHESFYRYVEPTGATPFSKPARDRALHAVALSIIRHIGEGLPYEDDAGKFTKEKYKSQIDQIKEYMTQRAKLIANRTNLNLEDESDDIAKEIEEFFDIWENLAQEDENLYYGGKFMVKNPEDSERRLIKQYNSAKNDKYAIDTMTSMRNVDSAVASNILVWEE